MSLSSDSKALQRKPFLLLSLKIGSQHEGGQSKTVIIEMTKEELDEFITSLEEVEKVCFKFNWYYIYYFNHWFFKGGCLS